MLDDFVDPSDMFVKQPNQLYGNKVADILSFLDEDTKKSYTDYLRGKTIGDPKNLKGIQEGNDSSNVSSDQYQQQMSDLTAAQYINERKRNGIKTDKETEKIEAQLIDRLGVGKGGEGLSDLEALQIKTVSKVLNPGLTMDSDMKAQFVIAAAANSYYLTQLEKAIDALFQLHGNRLQFDKNFYNSRTGVSSRVPFYGTYNSNAGITTNIVTGMGNNVSSIVSVNTVENQLQSSAKILYQLVTVGALQPNAELNIRPINIKTGNFEITQEDIDYNRTARKLKLPLKGSFVINDRTTAIGKAYNTFTGVDITVSYAIGYVVGNLKSMRAITWSLHRGKPSVPMAEEVPPTYRARGKRSIAGTMIFANFDEHPITAIYPSSFFPKDPDFGENNPIRPDFIKPDQLPAFDIFVILTNEYGWASLLALYGVEIMDDGGSFSMDDLLSEEVIQYTAKDIDLLHRVKTDKNGLIDPFELSSLQSQALFKKRSSIVFGDEGAAHYGSYDESIRNFSNVNATNR